MSRPRLLYLVHQFGELTGVSLHTEMLVRELAATFEISVAWPVSEIPGHPGLWGIRFRPADGDERIIVTAPPTWPVTAFREPTVEAAFQEILKWSAPDIIHIQHFLNWPLGSIDRAVESGAKVVVSFHDHYVLSPQYALTGFETDEEVVTAEYSRRVFGRDLSRHLVERREFLRRSLARVSARVAVSPYIEAKLQAVFPGEYRHIEYGIRPFEPLTRKPSARLRFGYLGQRVPMKGWDVLVQAFARVHQRFPNTELHCFCNAPDDAAAPDGVTFHGAYQPQDIASICSQFDVGVVPSVFAETYCMVLSELWLGGVPVIASEIGALRDRVLDGVNGWKFPAGDVAALADRLEWFATHHEWRDWILPSPRLVGEMVAEYDELYRELLNAGTSRKTSTLAVQRKLPGLGAVNQTQDRTDNRTARAVPLPDSSLPHAANSQPAPLLIVQTCEFADIGDAVHRMQAPSRAVAELPGISMVDCDIYHRRLPELAEQADVLIVHGLDAELLPLIEQRRAQGRVTVFEANDLVDDVHAWNPMAHVARDRSLRDIYQRFLEVADGIQTTTPELARRLRNRTDRPIGIFPNQLESLPSLRPAETEPTRLTIGWAGSPGHFADWYQLLPALETWLERHPEIDLAVMSGELAASFTRLPPERFHFELFGSLDDYFRFLDRLDIGLAPLLPTDYNRCRSDVKFLEYAARGVVGIYADLEPYRDSVEHGRTGFLYRTTAELLDLLDRLVSDAALRQQVRQQAYEHVAQHRRLADHASDRVDFYRGLLPSAQADRDGETTSSFAPVVAAVTRIPGYVALARDAAEQTVVDAFTQATTPQTAAVLQQVLDQFPHYRFAAQQLARMKNDLGDPRGAIRLLDQWSQPTTRMLCEQARSYFLLNDLDRSRELLNRALTHNPSEPQVWQYAVRWRLAAIRYPHLVSSQSLPTSPDMTVDWPDVDEFVTRATELHPSNLSLGLLLLKLYDNDAALHRVRGLLDRIVSTVTEEELPQVAAQFGDTLNGLVPTRLDQPAVLDLLQQTVRAFPQSVRLATWHGLALWQARREIESNAELTRAQSLYRAAQCQRAESPQADPHVARRQVAEHVSQRLSEAPPTDLNADGCFV